ncbi:male sterility protein-domain-containing protein [Infundibulicybe gibba]|nr:male sterility protein-domain-containing protein [Infundibulicybe gibba]
MPAQTNSLVAPSINSRLHAEKIQQMVEKYSVGQTAHWQIPELSAGPHHDNHITVLLSGTTGSLGSEILVQLLGHSSVDKVYALNRRSARGLSLARRHQHIFVSKGLDTSLLGSTKLVFLEGDATQEHFGLGEKQYQQLRDSVNIIIHNAWPINLNRPLESFEPNLCGTRKLIDMARSSANSATLKFLFVSSMTAAQSWDRADGFVPEEVLMDPGVAIGSGYGESKFAAEQIVANSGLQATSLRIVQICGRSTNGSWSPNDWFPVLVRSSLALGMLPEATGVVCWVPLDVVASSVLDVALSKDDLPELLNFAHPRPVQWETLIQSIADAIHKLGGPRLPIVPFRQWFSAVESSAKRIHEDAWKSNPATKLLDGFRVLALAEEATLVSGRRDLEHLGFKSYNTTKSRRISRSLNDLKPLSAADAEKWVQHWHDMGLLGRMAPFLSKM